MALLSGALTGREAAAGSITAASSSDPSHTTLVIDNTQTSYALPVVVFTLDFASGTPISLSLTVDGAGSYELIAATANVTNSTTENWSTFLIDFASAPAGSFFYGVGYNTSISPNQFQTATFYPNGSQTTALLLTGGTGVPGGQLTALEPGVTTTQAGTFVVRFTPNGSLPHVWGEIAFRATAATHNSSIFQGLASGIPVFFRKV